MSDYLNVEKPTYSNDASASSFGWNFQANAGIFLFLYYIKDANKIKIESALQDIEIDLVNGHKVLAQAKSAQDYSIAKDKKDKFKDAIISLVKNPQENNILIYISNIPDTLSTANEQFNNKIVSYNSCLSSIKKEIDQIFDSVIAYQSNKITSIEDEIAKNTLKTKTSKIDKKKKLACELKDKIIKFDKNCLSISVIHPYWGDEVNRYSIIENSILEFLSNKVQLDIDQAIAIKHKLLEHWQNEFAHNSTIKDGKQSKSITKEKFLWPVVIFSSDNLLDDICDCLTFQTDSAIDEEVKRIINRPATIYFERFEFTNKVLNCFRDFKNTNKGYKAKDLNSEFLKVEYLKFIKEFNSLSADEEIVEYLTKYFMHKIISNNRNITKIFAGTGVNK